MSGNTSSAVMQQRKEPKDSLDDFPTPPWATRAFLYYVLGEAAHSSDFTLEPCCNRGFMAKPLKEKFDTVVSTDIKHYGYVEMDGICDFIYPGQIEALLNGNPDWVFANPPFRLAEEFINRALGLAKKGVCIFARTSFLEGIDRYESIYKNNPPKIFAQYAERVILSKSRLLDPNDTYWHIDDKGKGEYRRPSTATSYAWFVWGDAIEPQPPVWIPPSRRTFERDGDYPGNPKEEGNMTGTLFE